MPENNLVNAKISFSCDNVYVLFLTKGISV